MSSYITELSKLSRGTKVGLQLVLDTFLLSLSFVSAMFLRLESFNFVDQRALWLSLIASIIATLLTLWALGFYRIITRYVTGKAFIPISMGVIMATISLYVSGLAFNTNLPKSVLVIFAVLAFLSIGTVRFIVRTHFRNRSNTNKRPVIIYGAGEAGRQLLNALFHSDEFIPVAMIDDDPYLNGFNIGGLQVYSPKKIPQVVQKTGARVILLAIPSTSRAQRRQIVSSLQDSGMEIKTIPDFSDIVSGRAKISELRTVSAADLLGRDPVPPDPELISEDTSGRVVMVSGAGGSIGGELCRQILHQNPSVLVLYEVSELALYTIEAELKAQAERLQLQTMIVPLIGSIQHSRPLQAAIQAFKVQTIYHAAAYKHVPLVEENVIEGIRNNVFGTLAITLAARKFNVEKFILISTDKAVRPTNVMGASKRIAELICQAQDQEAESTTFSMVRFGNVLGSSGSVIPRFQAQIEAGGPVTVTHEDITRYFMTIPEAAQLVIQAGALGKGGDVFVLDMGDPVKIMDMALSMVKLHGLTPHITNDPNQILPNEGDIAICVTGLRKGEKLYEELMIGNNSRRTKHPRIMTASEVLLPYAELTAVLDRLLQACTDFDFPAVIKILKELPLDYAPLDEDTSDLLWNAVQDIEGRHGVTVKAGGGA